MSKFHVKIGKLKPGVKFVKSGTTEENFKRCFNVDYCAETQKEL